MTFLPPNYEAPEASSKYMKLKQGDNVFRVLGDAIIGWIDWDNKKPIRTPHDQPKPKPVDPKNDVKHFWAFPVWDYEDKAIKVLEITQISIQNAINNYVADEAWGDPKNYDIVVKKVGEKMETKYAVMAKPPKEITTEISEAFKAVKIDLNLLFSGDDPFIKSDLPF
jgi:hypothetical protein